MSDERDELGLDLEDEDELEEVSNIVFLNDEQGNQLKFEFLDLIGYEGDDYVVLLPVLEDGDEDTGEVVILKVDKDEDEENESYVAVEDEALRAVFQIFKEKFADEFNFTDED
mgnify:CR=1 FL=1